MILGIDPGLENTGWGIIETGDEKQETRISGMWVI